MVFAIPCLFNKQLHELLFIKQIMFNIFHRTFPYTLSLPSSLSSKAQLHIFIQFFQLFSAIDPVDLQYIQPVFLVFFCLKTSSFLSLEHELSFSPWILYLSWNLLLFPDMPLTVHPMWQSLIKTGTLLLETKISLCIYYTHNLLI